MSFQYDILGSSPIPGAAPAGEDVRDDPDFERLQGEIDKLSNPSAAAGADWDIVQRAAAVLLAERGKDLLVACYLAGALMRQSGLDGLATGLKVVADLLTTYWPTLFPPVARLRARRNALAWLLERAQQYVADRVDRDVQQAPELIDALNAHLGAIEALLGEQDPDAPSVRPLLSQIRTLPVREPEPAAVAVQMVATPANGALAAPAAASAATPAARAGGATPAAGPQLAPLSQSVIVSEADADRAFEQIGERLVALAGWRRGADPADAQAYRLNRLAAWGAIDTAPRAERGQTRIPGPIAELAIALDRLQSGDAFVETVQFAEANLPAFPFWLDLNRASALALGKLGEPFAPALAEVVQATSHLLRRAPDLPGLSFADGKPFADGATLEWLASLRAESTGAGGASTSDALAVALADAKALAADGDLEAAALALQGAIAGAPPEQRLRAMMHLCELLLAHRPGVMVLPFSNVLVAEIDRHGLERWSPRLALEALSIAHSVALQAEQREDAARLLERIARLDAAAAIRLMTAA
ncbi:type VI secretion system protein TssA [Chitinasiproducens palmae]|uniref:Type VI secretion system protein VasJ n=1 Tax=Chitinasiproducens palmae TaxID=1770053 RepID=A0A1H2PMX9_9BURK|nr:type VI secretion system protein TssA [Chitinasiproducens palmae]SDV47126.1 type VI secretion system protein VasJ [Chitinasiproducens palmae]